MPFFTWPDNHGAIQTLQPIMAQLDTYMIGFVVTMIATLVFTLALPCLDTFGRCEGIMNGESYSVLGTCYFCHGVILACGTFLSILMHNGVFDDDKSLTEEHRIEFPKTTWTDVWDNHASNGHIGNSELISSAHLASPVCSVLVIVGILIARALD